MDEKYNLIIENWGGDSYMLASLGHHDIDNFKAECEKEYEYISEYLEKTNAQCQQSYFKVVPRDGYEKYYTPVDKSVRGCVPVTVWFE